MKISLSRFSELNYFVSGKCSVMNLENMATRWRLYYAYWDSACRVACGVLDSQWRSTPFLNFSKGVWFSEGPEGVRSRNFSEKKFRITLLDEVKSQTCP